MSLQVATLHAMRCHKSKLHGQARLSLAPVHQSAGIVGPNPSQRSNVQTNTESLQPSPRPRASRQGQRQDPPHLITPVFPLWFLGRTLAVVLVPTPVANSPWMDRWRASKPDGNETTGALASVRFGNPRWRTHAARLQKNSRWCSGGEI